MPRLRVVVLEVRAKIIVKFCPHRIDDDCSGEEEDGELIQNCAILRTQSPDPHVTAILSICVSDLALLTDVM